MKDWLIVFMNWTTDDGFVRPLLVLVACILLLNVTTFVFKIRLLIRSVVYFIFCWDSKWKKPTDPGSIFGPHLSQGLEVERKTVFFVRHGESTWNHTFYKGDHRSSIQFAIGFIPGLIQSLYRQLMLVLSGRCYDCYFFDSPLSSRGLDQVNELFLFLNERPLENCPEAKYIQILRGEESDNCVLVSSPLRKAVGTMVVGFRERIKGSSIQVWDCLQDVGRLPHTLSITPPRTPIRPSWIEEESDICDFQDIYDHYVDMSRHLGEKPVRSKGLVRMLEFCEHIFQSDYDNTIVCGHALWFRYFFRSFLPFAVRHDVKKKEIVNGGVVVFDLIKAETEAGARYMVDPKTIRSVYGGFS